VSADQAGSSEREIEEGLGATEIIKSGPRRGAGVGDVIMMPSLRFREYIEAANLAHQRAQSERNSHAKEIFQEIERSYHRLIEMEKWEQQKCNRSFVHFGRSTDDKAWR
jgi:hypothetical protein